MAKKRKIRPALSNLELVEQVNQLENKVSSLISELAFLEKEEMRQHHLFVFKHFENAFLTSILKGKTSKKKHKRMTKEAKFWAKKMLDLYESKQVEIPE